MPNTNINNHEKPNKAHPIISHNVIQKYKTYSNIRDMNIGCNPIFVEGYPSFDMH
jgi:hypothetical protein